MKDKKKSLALYKELLVQQPEFQRLSEALDKAQRNNLINLIEHCFGHGYDWGERRGRESVFEEERRFA